MGNSIQKIAFQPPNPASRFPSKFSPPQYAKTAEGHQIPVLHFPYPDSDLTLFFSHGNACDLGQQAEYLHYLSRQLKISVVGYEYLGYGHCLYNHKPSSLSKNKSPTDCPSNFPSENGTYQSIEAVYQWAKKKLKLHDHQMIWMGQSIGSGPTTHHCSRHPSCAMILVTPFKSAVKVVTEYSSVSSVDFFENHNKIADINCPILIIHGTADSVVPFSHGKELYQILRDESKNPTAVWIEGADHNDLDNFPQYLTGLNDFLRKLN